jgi:hypothetical protein
VLLFGHIGITAGIVRVGDILGSMNRPLDGHEADSKPWFNPAVSKKLLTLWRCMNGIRNQLGSIDYRLVLIGSLLPDILDKPLWLIASSDIFPSGRAYGHSFLLNIVLFIFGLILIKYGKSWLLILSISSIFHLVLDRIWTNPVTFWWPLLGPIPREETTSWVSDMIRTLSLNPGVYIPEIAGLIIVLLLGYKVIVRKNVIKFIRTGAIDFRRPA